MCVLYIYIYIYIHIRGMRIFRERNRLELIIWLNRIEGFQLRPITPSSGHLPPWQWVGSRENLRHAAWLHLT